LSESRMGYVLNHISTRKSACPVVRPGKAGMFSRKISLPG
jgi:hypothetical protein